jgi:nicotinic acid phosphoribosyltransferase
MQPVITSLLDTDLYKFTMWQAMLHRHPATQAEYTFVCRNSPAYPLAELLGEVDRELDALCALSFRPSELAYLGSLPTSSTSCASSASSATSSAPAPPRTARDSRSSPAARRCT